MNFTGCEFKILRNTTNPKVLSMSLWKSNVKYIFNLSNTLIWWGDNGQRLFPDWNIRIYIDYNIRKPLETIEDRTEDIDWDMIIQTMKTYNNIELWFYNCKWGQDKNEKHIKTFGSLVRFHAFQDPSVEYAVCKNIELLSSVKDARIINEWAISGKKYLTYYDIQKGYNCDYGNIAMCKALGLENTNMVLATFGMDCKRNIHRNDLFDKMMTMRNMNFKVLEKFPYGIEEIFLTKLYKQDMNQNNTFIVPRSVLTELIGYFLDNKYFSVIQKDVYEFLKEGFTLSEEEKKIMIDKFDINYKNNWASLAAVLVRIASDFPNINAKLINFLKLKYQYENQEEKQFFDNIKEESQQYHLQLFLNNNLQNKDDEDDEDDDDYDDEKKEENHKFLCRAQNEREAKLYFYFALETYLLEEIDWKGTCLKSKDGYIIPRKPKIEIVIFELKEKVENQVNDYINTENKLSKLKKESNPKQLMIRNLERFLVTNISLKKYLKKDVETGKYLYLEKGKKKTEDYYILNNIGIELESYQTLVDDTFTKLLEEYENKKQSFNTRLLFAYISPNL
jgi:hypothetical protein